MIFDQGFKRGEGGSGTHISRKRIPGRENSKHKDLKVGEYLAYLKGDKKVSIAEAE